MIVAALVEDRLRALWECLDDEAPLAVRMIDIEQLADHVHVGTSQTGAPYRRLLALVRKSGRPLGWASLPVASNGMVSLQPLAAIAKCSPDEPVIGLDGDTDDPHAGAVGEGSREALVTVVIATCADADSVLRCVEAICTGDTGPMEVVVVENRPQNSSVRGALEERFAADTRIRYVEEYRPGLAQARNAGLRAARGELVAFTDDDVIVDRRWISTLREVFAAMPKVSCVTGLIVPLELENAAQLSLERFGSYGKGFTQRVYSIERPPPDQPLFPYAAGHFCSGANMALRASALHALGGFDPVLGTGTPARGSEDLDICIRVLQAGGELAYEPRALVWHRHPDTPAGLRRRAFDYGAALGALLSKHLLVGPHRWSIVARIPGGIRYLADPRSRKNAARGPSFPRRLVWLERAGLLYGPIAYLASRLHTSR
jgi:O-antigen biosynthesis protein